MAPPGLPRAIVPVARHLSGASFSPLLNTIALATASDQYAIISQKHAARAEPGQCGEPADHRRNGDDWLARRGASFVSQRLQPIEADDAHCRGQP